MSSENEQDSGKTPLRIFVDANTFVSGLLFEGNEATLIRLGAVGLCRLATTPYVLDEVTGALSAAEFQLSDDEISVLLSYVNRCVRVYENPSADELREDLTRLNDKKDLHVLVAFKKLECDMLVTGDKELLRKVPDAKRTKQALEILLLRSAHE